MPLPAGPVVGTCGFGYPEWRGRFYPPELAPGGWLGFYAQVFEAVELDGTFYRPPEPSQVAVWAEALPDRFAVAAKVPRAITHEARLEGEAAAGMLRAFAHALDPLGDRLLAVVLQLPPSLDADEGRERLARLLGDRPDGLPVVVEVRHRSWDRPWLAELLAAAGAGSVLADRPGETPWPSVAGGVGYLRLLGDRRATPVIGRPVRDRAAELDRWAALLARATPADGAAPPARRPAAAFANNRFEGAAFDTAAALRRRLGQQTPRPRELWPAPPLPGLEP
ncbi:MAG TPA: DUF72 domain-containing protein [Actinomycetota bacterium]|nr:DUF72 domain-containing protein [Actinomycetota bacterium]